MHNSHEEIVWGRGDWFAYNVCLATNGSELQGQTHMENEFFGRSKGSSSSWEEKEVVEFIC